MDRRALELEQHPVPERDRVGEVLEPDAVLGEAGNRKRARRRAERHDEAFVADLERAGQRLDRHGTSVVVVPGDAPENELGMRAHLAERDHDVARLERPGRRLGQERRVEHEVLERHDRRAAALEEPSRRSCRRSLRRG